MRLVQQRKEGVHKTLMMDRKLLHRILSIAVVLLSIAGTSATPVALDRTLAAGDAQSSNTTKIKSLKVTDDEIRFEFNPTGPFADLTKYYSVFMVIKQTGKARALRYGLRFQARNVAVYEGVLPEAESQRLFARVRAAFRLPKYRKEYDRRRVYHGDGFYLALVSDRNVKEMLGNLETRPDEVRALLPDMSQLWKKLIEVPPAYAYLTSWPIEKDRLRRLRREYKVYPTPIESLPASLQALLIPVVTQPRNFHPLTQAQYDQYQRFHRPLTYKGAGYEPEVILAANEVELKK